MRWTLPVVFVAVLCTAYATQTDRPASKPAVRIDTSPATARNPVPASAARQAPDWQNANRYGIRYWPSFVLIDKKGQIRYDGYGEVHVGDAAHAEWVRRIDALLAE